MGAVFCFLLFLAAVALCLLEGWSLIAAIWAGILFFGLLGLRKGFSIKAMASAAWAQGRKMCCVIVIYSASRSAAFHPKAVCGHFGNPALASR